MTFKNFLDEAITKGETLKEEITSELLKSRMLEDIIHSDLFEKAISTVLRTKDEVTKVIRQNVKSVLQIMDVPSRNDLQHLAHKLDRLEKLVDRVGKRAITVKSLKHIQLKKAAKRR